MKQADPTPTDAASRLDVRLGISACLLGERVRLDGGHKRNHFLVEELGRHVTWVPVCPEVEMGLSTPRPPMRLVRTGGRTASGEFHSRMVVTESGEDLTDAMRAWAARRLPQLDPDLDGYVFKKDSPSCGLFRVKVYDANGSPSPLGTGVWADAFTRRHPQLPAEEEGRLNDPLLREHFVLRAFTHARWRRFLREDFSPAGLVRFHTEHKLTLLAHDPTRYAVLGRVVARAGTGSLEETARTYHAGLAAALTRRASRGRHVNAMQHLAGFVKDAVGADDKRELEEIFGRYRAGIVPLVVPLTLLRHLLRRHARNEWAARQTYLEPYPAELMLRNAV